jgi:hypothetical protein
MSIAFTFLPQLSRASNITPSPHIEFGLTNQVGTIVAIEGIPPFATNCELRVTAPPENLLWQEASYESGDTDGSVDMWIYPLNLAIAQSHSWTWNTYAAASPRQIQGLDALAGVMLTAGMVEVIYQLPSCPPVTGPSGGSVGFVFGIIHTAIYRLASVFLGGNQD